MNYNTITDDDLTILQDVINRREKRARDLAYQMPVEQTDLQNAFSQNQLGALAKAISNMSASAGTYQGKSANQMGFGEIVDDLGRGVGQDIQTRLALEKQGDRALLENIALREDKRKLQQVKDDETRLQKMESQPLAEYDRVLAEETIRQLVPNYKLPEGITYGEFKRSPVLAPLSQRMRNQQFITPYQQEMLDLNKQRLEEEKRQSSSKTELEREKLKLEKEKELKPKVSPKEIETLRKSEIEAAQLDQILDELQELSEKHGYAEPTNPAINARMKALSSQALLKLKDQNGLGVLNVGDRPILEDILGTYGDSRAAVLNTADYNMEGSKAKLDFVRKQVRQGLENQRKLLGPTAENVPTLSKPPGSSSKFPRIIHKGNNQATVNSEAELKEAQAEGWQ